MTAPDLAAEAAELRSTIAGLRAEAAELAASLQTMASAVCAMNSILAIALAAREEGRREGRGELGAYEAAAQALLLARGDGTAAPLPTPAAQLEEIRLVLEAFDWKTDDRQYALEQIEQIMSGGDR